MRAQRFYVVRGEAPDNFRGVASGCPLFRGKNVRESSLVPRLSLRHSGVQRSYVKIVRGEGEPGNEAT